MVGNLPRGYCFTRLILLGSGLPTRIWQLVLVVDDASRRVHSGLFVRSEEIQTRFSTVDETILVKGLFKAIHVDRALRSHHDCQSSGKGGGNRLMRPARTYESGIATKPPASAIVRLSNSSWRTSGLEVARITAGNRLKSYRAARSAFPAVGRDPAEPCRESGKTGSEWRDSRAPLPRQQIHTGLRRCANREPRRAHHAGIRRTTTECTSNSPSSMKANNPSGPKAFGMGVPSGKLPK